MHRLVPVSLLLSLVGCKTWEPAATPAQRFIADARPSSVRVTSADGVRVTLKNPIFINDSWPASDPSPRRRTTASGPRAGAYSSDFWV